MPSNNDPFNRLPFTPRIVVAEPAPLTDTGELELPDDLAALADQLSDDAAHLSSKYPASDAPVVPKSVVSSGSRDPVDASGPKRAAMRQRASTFALASCVAVAALSLITLSSAIFNDQITEPSEQSISARDSQPSESTSEFTPVRVSLATDEQAEPVSRPLIMLGGASGPEREGLLDLWRDEAGERASISF
jgi:hypothetical protein